MHITPNFLLRLCHLGASQTHESADNYNQTGDKNFPKLLTSLSKSNRVNMVIYSLQINLVGNSADEIVN